MINRRIAYTLVIIWMMVIFSLSSQVRDKSDNLSGGVTKVVTKVVEKVAPHKATNFGKMNHIIRKNAHFIAYFILGILSIYALRGRGVSHWKGAMGAFLICVLYAISDEIHQAFVPGRGPGVKDVLIDSAGAMVGIVLYLLVAKGMSRFRKRNEAI